MYIRPCRVLHFVALTIVPHRNCALVQTVSLVNGTPIRNAHWLIARNGEIYRLCFMETEAPRCKFVRRRTCNNNNNKRKQPQRPSRPGCLKKKRPYWTGCASHLCSDAIAKCIVRRRDLADPWTGLLEQSTTHCFRPALKTHLFQTACFRLYFSSS